MRTTQDPRDSLMIKIAILSIALLLQMPAIIAPILPLMEQTFSQYSTAQVEMISTISSFGVLIFVLLSGFTIRYLGIYKTMVIGMVLALFAGLVPVFSENYNVILLSRFLLGGGIGLFNGLSYSLILRIYKGKIQKQLLGLQGATTNIIMMGLTFIIGGLVGYGWHTVFWVYLVALVPLTLVLIYGQKIERLANEVKDEKPKVVEKTNFAVMRYGAEALIVFTIFSAGQLKLTNVLLETGAGNASVAAALLGWCTVVGILGSIAYGSIYNLFKSYTLPIAIIGMGVALVIVSVGQTLPVIAVGQALLLANFVVAGPSLFAGASEVQPTGSDNLTSIVLLSWINIGVFLTPTSLQFIGTIFKTNGSAQSILRICGFILFALAAYMLLKLMMGKKNKVYGAKVSD